MRAHTESLAIPQVSDDAEIRAKYRPFLLEPEIEASDWVSQLELDTTIDMAQDHLNKTNGERLKILMLYGSLRKRYLLHISRTFDKR